MPYVKMLVVKPEGARLVSQEYDIGIIKRLVKSPAAQFTAMTPRLGLFHNPFQITTKQTGIMRLPMLHEPVRRLISEPFVVLAFDRGKAVSMNEWDVYKFQLLYWRSSPPVQETKAELATSEA